MLTDVIPVVDCVFRSHIVNEESKTLFYCQSVSDTIITKNYKFLRKYIHLDNELCKLFNDEAMADLSA